jgi:hypothetical protein
MTRTDTYYASSRLSAPTATNANTLSPTAKGVVCQGCYQNKPLENRLTHQPLTLGNDRQEDCRDGISNAKTVTTADFRTMTRANQAIVVLSQQGG